MTKFGSFVLVAPSIQVAVIREFVKEIEDFARSHFGDYEIIVVFTSEVALLSQGLSTLIEEFSNLMVIESSGKLSSTEASILALSQCIGDEIVLMEPDSGQVKALHTLLGAAPNTAMVLGYPHSKSKVSLRKRIGYALFSPLFRLVHGSGSAKQVPLFRVMKRDVLTQLLASANPELLLRHPGLAGASGVEVIHYIPSGTYRPTVTLWMEYSSAMQMLLGGSKLPLRAASFLGFLGAIANLVYAIYVVSIALVNSDIARGWASTSLQLSGMFFLVSLVLLLMSEYLLQLSPPSNFTRLLASPEFTGNQLNSRNIVTPENPHESKRD